MKTTESILARAGERWEEQDRLENELMTLSAHLTAATARWLELAWEFCESVESDDYAGYLA